MWTLSGFIDEISDDFSLQCKVASDLGLRYVEVRSAWGINILDLDERQLATLRETLAEYGCRFQHWVPIGKINIDDPFPPHLERMRHAGGRPNARGAVHQNLLVFHSRGHGPRQPPR